MFSHFKLVNKVQNHGKDKILSTGEDSAFLRFASAVGRLAGEWLAKSEIASNDSIEPTSKRDGKSVKSDTDSASE